MITLSQVALRRGTKLLFHDATARIAPGAKIGLVGRNGSGKSSLLSALLGELGPDAGDIQCPSGIATAVLRQEIPASDATALEFVKGGDEDLTRTERELTTCVDGHRLAELHATMDAIDGYSANARASKLIVGLGFSAAEVERPVASFSGGWRMRLNLAQTLMCRSELLLLDEPTNHLDFEAVVWLERWLRRYVGTLILISHDREFLDNVVERVFHLDGHTLTEYPGNYSDFERMRAERLASAQAMKDRQAREVQRISRFVERFRAKATKARQAQSRLKALERMERVSIAHIDTPFTFRFPTEARCPDTLLSLERVSAQYENEPPVLKDLELTLTPGLRLGLLGFNGAGKSTLMRVLAGLHAPSAGTRAAHPNSRVGYFAQHQLEALDLGATPLLHLRRQHPDRTDQRHRDFLGGFGFGSEMADATVQHFSGGEKSRLVLALLVAQGPNVLLLDEPTNHLDLDMRHALEVALQDFSGALVLVSHDRHLLRTATDELLLIHESRAHPFQGDIESYQGHVATSDDLRPTAAAPTPEGTRKENGSDPSYSPAPPPPPDRKAQRREAAAERERQRPLTARLKRVETLMERLGSERAALDAALAEPALYKPENKVKLDEHLFARARTAQELEALEAEWLALEEAREAT